MAQQNGFSEAAKTLLQAKWILGIGIILVLFTPYLFTKHALTNELDFTGTGQIGDTIGGISAPIVSLLGSVLVFLALKAQTQATNLAQVQIDDQRSQYYVNRITDIIYLQLDRINESIKAQSFTPGSASSQKISGYSGLYALNDALERERAKLQYDNPSSGLKELIISNVGQLTEVYENTSTAIKITNDLLKSSNLTALQKNELRRLLVLNLGSIMKNNADKISEYVAGHGKNVSESAFVESTWSTNNQTDQLGNLVAVVRVFFDENSPVFPSS